jgi:AraC family transcriptional regulator
VAAGTRVPDGMAKWKLPAQTCAVFTHRGPIVRIEETFARIYREWLPASGCEPVGEGSIECYDDARFGDGGAASELDILIPVQPFRR